MSTRKNGIGSDVVPFSISGEGFHLVAAIRHNGGYSLHPIRVFRKGFNICKRFGLSGEGPVGPRLKPQRNLNSPLQAYTQVKA